MQQVKQILVTRSSMPDYEEYCEEIKKLWDSHWLTNMGVEHEMLQQELERFLGCPHVVLYTNGHLAVENVIAAMQFPEGAEVSTTPFTFVSTTHAIVRNGLTPVFCDVNPEDYTIDTDKIESLITDKTAAIVPVHVYGNVCNVEEIELIAHKYELKVLYDAAHTFGVTYKGRSTASFGDVSCFSFHATKVFHTIEGGAACFRDEDFGKKLYQLKNFGIKNAECVDGIGANAKMNEFCAAMGLCNLRHVGDEIAKRGRVVARYRERLAGVPGVQLNPVQKDVKPNYAYFPVVFEEEAFGATRNEVADALAAQGISARKYFYPLTNTFECFHGAFDVEKTPVALHLSRHVLTLPLYAELALEDVDRICDIVLACRKA